jgi:hypothetical protein
MIKYLFAICFLFVFGVVYADDSLLYLEVQGIAGYSSMNNKIIYNSAHKDADMQKNSIGFDYIKKISGKNSDLGNAALQTRLVYDENEEKLKLQFYNAYVKGKTSFADIWVGHSRIAFGLASYFDTHADLFQPLSMYGFGFDRDWGLGISRDTENGDIRVAVTTGTGMEIKVDNNWLFSTRFSLGVLENDNYNMGFSFMGGKTSEELAIAGLDYTYYYNNIEYRAEFDFGEKAKKSAYALLYRLTFNLGEENRLKLDAQYVYTKQYDMKDYSLGTGLTYRINSDLAFRTMYEWQHEMDAHRVVAQIYYYFGM